MSTMSESSRSLSPSKWYVLCQPNLRVLIIPPSWQYETMLQRTIPAFFIGDSAYRIRVGSSCPFGTNFAHQTWPWLKLPNTHPSLKTEATFHSRHARKGEGLVRDVFIEEFVSRGHTLQKYSPYIPIPPHTRWGGSFGLKVHVLGARSLLWTWRCLSSAYSWPYHL